MALSCAVNFFAKSLIQRHDQGRGTVVHNSTMLYLLASKQGSRTEGDPTAIAAKPLRIKWMNVSRYGSNGYKDVALRAIIYMAEVMC